MLRMRGILADKDIPNESGVAIDLMFYTSNKLTFIVWIVKIKIIRL